MHINTVLIVSARPATIDIFRQHLDTECLTVAENAAQARTLLAEREFELCIFDTPLADEFGCNLAIHVAKDCACIVLTTHFVYDEIFSKLEGSGAFLVPKPINTELLITVLNLASTHIARLTQLVAENKKLRRQLDDQKSIARAKCILIETMRIDEPSAHRYIEKHAMDGRISRRAVAEMVIADYEKAKL